MRPVNDPRTRRGIGLTSRRCLIFSTRPWPKSFSLDPLTLSLSLSDVALAVKLLHTMTPSLNLLSLALLLAPISSVLASNDCAPSTWSKAGLKIRQVETSSTSRNPLSSSASLALSITSSPSRSTSSTSSVSAGAAPTAVNIISTGNVTTGEVNCRYSGTTGSAVNYYSCSLLSKFYGISNELFFALNPQLALDCSNIEPNAPYCVSGCKFPQRRVLARLHRKVY